MPFDDDVRETPPAVVGAVSIGTAPLPFLAVYAALFILHGTVRPVHPPDITSSQTGELIAGIVALAIFVITSLALLQFLNGRRRWPFVVIETAFLVVAVYFVLDDTTGGTVISLLVAASSLVSLVFGFAPQSWTHVGRPMPPAVSRVYGRRPGPRQVERSLPRSSASSAVEPGALRRQRASMSGEDGTSGQI